jgi:formate hydrogenlyase transcriptional activator
MRAARIALIASNPAPMGRFKNLKRMNRMPPEPSSPAQTIDATTVEDQLLCIAAMFENDFTIDWLGDLTGYKPTRLLSILEKEVEKKSLCSKGPGVYSFVDKKQRRPYLEMLSQDEKKAYHRQIADLLMNEVTENADNAYLLSHHLLQTSNDLEQSRCLVKAGDIHLQRYANEIAFQCYAKVIEDLSDMHGEESDRLFCETAIKYSKLSTARHNTNKVLDTLVDAIERSRRLNDKSLQALLWMHIAKNEWLLVKYGKALSNFDRGWNLAKELGDPKLLQTATTFSTFFLYWQGRFKEAVETYERSVPDIHKLPEARFPTLAAITVGYCYSQIGQITQGLGMLDAIRSKCLDRGDIYLASYCSGNMGAIMISIRHLEEARKYLKTAYSEAKESHNDWVLINSLIMSAYAYFLNGQNKNCIRDLKMFLERSREVQATVQPYPYILSLSAAMAKGDLSKVRGISLKEEINRKLRGKNVYMKGVAYRYKSHLQRAENEKPDKIRDTLKLSLKWGEQSGHAIHLAKTRLELARVHLSTGDDERAIDLAKKGTAVLMPMNEALVPDDLRGLAAGSTTPDTLLKEILQVAKEVVAIRKHKDLLQHVITTVNRLTGAERGAIFLIDEDTTPTKLKLRGSKNLTPTDIGHPDFASSMAVIEKVAKTGVGTITENDASEKENLLSSGTIRSCICVPMVLRSKVVGVLYHDNRLLRSAFKESHLELLSYFAAIAAISLDNSLAYQEIHRLNDKLKDEKQYYQEEHIQSLHFKEIVGKSPAIHKVLSQIQQVSETEATVLITGETGVGKELVARAIHRSGKRRKKPFIRVHCSALPENLIPSELFGHEKGAFTGATGRRVGRFELADTGTIFLDEMGEISPDIQTRLLRVLQTREFERVGGTETLRSDFRLIAATNRDLQQEVNATRFRADLYYRLNVFPIHVPPLRERKEDIPLLVYHFLNIHSNRVGKNFDRINEEDMNRLLFYDWPGNVRELENVIERACILSNGNFPLIPELENECEETSLYGEQGEGVTLKEVEARHIRWALEKTSWKVRGNGGAAELLEIHPSTLRFRMKKLGIIRPPK